MSLISKRHSDIVQIGDKIRFSVEILQQIRDDGNHTMLAEVCDITVDEKGEKCVWMRNVRDEHPS